MNILKAAHEIAHFLENENIPYFIIGGLALQHWGEPRLTRDVDITVLVAPERFDAFVDAVLKNFPSRVPDAREFALRHRVLLVQTEERVPLDISLGIPGYEEDAFRRAAIVEYEGTGKLRLVAPEDLIIHKCVAGRPRDIEDVEGILIRQQLNLDISLIKMWLEAFGKVIDAHNPVQLFEHALKDAEEILRKSGSDS
ncbi:MAG: nucleotidyl transferase AbiEii/AbiGii toxin family protein [Bacteroidota bacterium]